LSDQVNEWLARTRCFWDNFSEKM
jgi:hypothetical protein